MRRSAPDNGTFTVAAKVKDYGVSEDVCLDLMLEHWRDDRGLDKDDEHVKFRVENAYRYGQNAVGSSSAEAEFEPVEIDAARPAASAIQLYPVVPFEAEDVPRRRFVLGKFAARQYLSGIISPPGVGKTTFLIMCAVAAATGREDITGFKVHERVRVLLWNQEDELNELKRRLLAVMAAFGVGWSDLEIDGRSGVILGSGVDKSLLFAQRRNEGLVLSKDAEAVERYIIENEIGLAIFDPFVEMHPADENNNVEIAAVARMFRRVAVRANCAVLLAHHTRKPPAAASGEAYAGNMDSARGAGALNGVARMVATLYTLDATTAKKFGVGEDEARLYVRFDDAKSNLSLVSSKPVFFKREGVTIGGPDGEDVGVLRPAILRRAKTAKEEIADENETILSVIPGLLKTAKGHKLSITDIAGKLLLLECEQIEGMTPDALRKRLNSIFEQAVTLEDGSKITLHRDESLPGKPGRHNVLKANFAE